MKKSKHTLGYSVMLISLSFILGSIVSNLVPFSAADTQTPFSIFRTPEILSPNDWITENQIHVYKDRIVLNIENASWAKFTDTNSMDPLFDIESNTIEIKPENPSNLKVGDIISYQSNVLGTVVIHRIINIKEDEQGVYFVTKGDNNLYKDPEKIRFEQIKGVVVGIIY